MQLGVLNWVTDIPGCGISYTIIDVNTGISPFNIVLAGASLLINPGSTGVFEIELTGTSS